MVEENPRDVGHEMDGLSIVYGDESLPRLYENSRISSEQLPSQTGKLRCIYVIRSALCFVGTGMSIVPYMIQVHAYGIYLKN